MYVEGVKYSTMNKRSKAMSKVSKVVSLILEVSNGYYILYIEASHPSKGKGYCLLSCGFSRFSSSPVQRAVFLNFFRLVSYKHDCRQDAQPTPNS